MGPWTTEQIAEARRVPLLALLGYLGAYVKRDAEYHSLEPGRGSFRIQVGLDGRDYRFIVTGEKWVSELLPKDCPDRGGGGAIDFARHVTGANFVQAVKLCLDAKHAQGGSR